MLLLSLIAKYAGHYHSCLSRMIESLSLLSHWIHYIPSRGLIPSLCFYSPKGVEASNLLSTLFNYRSAILAKCCFCIDLISMSFFHMCPKAIFFKLPRHFFCLASEMMLPKRENCPLCLFYKLVFSISHVSIFSVKIFESSKRVLSALLCFILVLVYPEVKQNLSTCDDFFLEV